MTFPGVFMMEWMVVCGMNLTTAKRIHEVVNVAYLVLGHEAGNTCKVFKPLLSGLFWLTKRSREGYVAIVLVQVLCDKAQVLLFESLTPFAYESNLWGIGAC